jgi:TPR repeat protein
VRCTRCGNENPETNRFCGFCGVTLGQAAPTVASSASQAPAPSLPTTRAKPAEDPVADAPAPVAPRPSALQDSPVISGPSFLGLNDPAPSQRRRGSLSIDPQSAPSSRDLKYLLDDEEEPKGGGGWKFVLIVLALALAVGFGYLRWKDQGFTWLNGSAKKPSASAQSSDGADVGSAAAPATSSPASSDSSTAPSASTPQPATGTTPAPAASANPASAAPGNSAGTSPANSPSTSVPAATGSGSAPGNVSDSVGAAVPAKTAESTPRASSKDADDSADSPPPAAATEQPKPAPPGPAPKPRPAVVRDPVSEAQKYIYGKGATQDCDRGLRLLKPAADQANPKAMIEMGALYSAGLCTPRDLPTAYRWFALALRKEPDNQAVQTDLQKLWGEMTQPERQLAIRLSQ